MPFNKQDVKNQNQQSRRQQWKKLLWKFWRLISVEQRRLTGDRVKSASRWMDYRVRHTQLFFISTMYRKIKNDRWAEAMTLWLGDPWAAKKHHPWRLRSCCKIVLKKDQHILTEWFWCCPSLWQMMKKATSSSLFAQAVCFLLSHNISDSKFVTADASLAPVNSVVALLREPLQAWFIIPVHWLDTTHSCLDAISSWDASLSPFSNSRVSATSSFS